MNASLSFNKFLTKMGKLISLSILLQGRSYLYANIVTKPIDDRDTKEVLIIVS